MYVRHKGKSEKECLATDVCINKQAKQLCAIAETMFFCFGKDRGFCISTTPIRKAMIIDIRMQSESVALVFQVYENRLHKHMTFCIVLEEKEREELFQSKRKLHVHKCITTKSTLVEWQLIN